MVLSPGTVDSLIDETPVDSLGKRINEKDFSEDNVQVMQLFCALALDGCIDVPTCGGHPGRAHCDMQP